MCGCTQVRQVHTHTQFTLCTRGTHGAVKISYSRGQTVAINGMSRIQYSNTIPVFYCSKEVVN